jgi:CRISPR/Cas system-associated exonuclease Cas4 (RecB family)
VKGRKKGEDRVPSHACDQMTTPDLYLEACAEGGVDPDPGTVAYLEQRRWQVRHTLTFRRSEIEEAGRELVSAAHLIAQLDSGALWPVRNESTLRCGGCAFREICPRPDDDELIALNFERRVPKRDKELEAA